MVLFPNGHLFSEHRLHVLNIIRGQNKEKTYCFSLRNVFSCHEDKTFPHKTIRKKKQVSTNLALGFRLVNFPFLPWEGRNQEWCVQNAVIMNIVMEGLY